MKWSIFLALLLVFPYVGALASSENFIYYGIENNIVNVNNMINLNLDSNITLDIKLPMKYNGLSVTLDGEDADYTINNNLLSVDILGGERVLTVDYSTDVFLEESSKNFFIVEFLNPFFARKLLVQVILPEGSVLDKAVDEGESVYPEPSTVTSDGQRIIIVWEKEAAEKGLSLPIFIAYRENNSIIGYVVAFFAVVFLVLLFLFIKNRKTEVKTEIKERIIKQPELHLKEDEKKIVSIIKQKGGKVEQGTLVVISDYSKAKVSQLVKELEERKIIKKIKKGKKNIIILVSKILDFEND